MNQLGSRDEAEDAVQTTFLNAHRALQRGVTPEAELPWLFKIAHNVCLTRRRSARRRVRIESPSDLGAVQDVLPAPARDSADELLRLTDALGDMPTSQRRAILLREWQGLSYHEIADELELSQSAVETLIFRARRTLASKLRTDADGPRPVARLRQALDGGALLTGLKTLFGSGAAVKVAAVAVVASGVTVAATAAHHDTVRPNAKHGALTSGTPGPTKASPTASAPGPGVGHGAKTAARAPRRPVSRAAPASAPTAAPAAPQAASSAEGLTAPPGQSITPPGQAKAPPGQAKRPSGQKTPPGQERTPPGQTKTPPGQLEKPEIPKQNELPAQAQKPAEPPKAQPEPPSAADEHGPPADPGEAPQESASKK